MSCSVLQCVAVCCSVLHWVAVRCSEPLCNISLATRSVLDVVRSLVNSNSSTEEGFGILVGLKDAFVCLIYVTVKLVSGITHKFVISKLQSLPSMRIVDCTLRVPHKTTTLFYHEEY